jgi:diacylglycerol kinase
MINFLKGFSYAFAGIWQMVLHERNFKIHVLAFIVVVSAGFYFQVTPNEWLILLLISALVLALETINSAIEKMCDLYTTETHPQLKLIKDIAAGAVLIAAIFAVVIAIIIFKKYIILTLFI